MERKGENLSNYEVVRSKMDKGEEETHRNP